MSLFQVFLITAAAFVAFILKNTDLQTFDISKLCNVDLSIEQKFPTCLITDPFLKYCIAYPTPKIKGRIKTR